MIPRLRLFLWKLVQNALPLAKVLNHRLSTGDPYCQTCKQEEESTQHLLFSCPFSKACWFAGPLPLQTDQFVQMEDTKEAIKALAQITSDEDWSSITCVIWAIWRCRNDQTYSAKQATFSQFKSYFTAIWLETSIMAWGLHKSVQLLQEAPIEDADHMLHCQVDGSWIANWEGGIGQII